MSNLQSIILNIEEELNYFNRFDISVNYQNHVKNLREQFKEFKEYVGIRELKQDIGPFHRGELVLCTQDEGGAWITSLDSENRRVHDMFDEPMVSPQDLFK